MQINKTCQVELNRLNMGRKSAIFVEASGDFDFNGCKTGSAHRARLNSQDHHLSGLDQSCGNLAYLQTHLAHRIGGDH
jgi:hypothetical protein